MPSNKPQLKTYVDTPTYEKFKIIANNENRSASNYLELLVLREIENYELKHGTISIKNVNIIDNRGSTNNISM